MSLLQGCFISIILIRKFIQERFFPPRNDEQGGEPQQGVVYRANEDNEPVETTQLNE
jgi:hypothetical protein